jgi:hypothetical protein
MEPKNHYIWRQGKVDGNPSNVLIGRSPSKGSPPCEDAEWNGWNDPEPTQVKTLKNILFIAVQDTLRPNLIEKYFFFLNVTDFG